MVDQGSEQIILFLERAVLLDSVPPTEGVQKRGGRRRHSSGIRPFGVAAWRLAGFVMERAYREFFEFGLK